MYTLLYFWKDFAKRCLAKQTSRCLCSTPRLTSSRCTLVTRSSPPLSLTTCFATMDTTFRYTWEDKRWNKKENWHIFCLQAINYPTVARGEEKLRVAPTPHHTKWVNVLKKAIAKLILNLLFREMMDQFVLDLTSEWKALGLPLNPKLGACQPASCAYCRCSATQYFLLIKMCPLKLLLFRQPAEFARLAARECPLASTGRACPLGELATVAA